MNRSLLMLAAITIIFSGPAFPFASESPVEVSSDGHETVILVPSETDGSVIASRSSVPYGAAPDWQNNLRRQVGGLQVADMNGDGRMDVVAGCYISSSYPPYDHWENLIYFNTGTELETDPSWVSADEVSTGDVQVADIDNDSFPDIFAANGGSSMSPSVIYWGSAAGPSPSPGWISAEPALAWNNYALPFDIDHDGDVDMITANQGNSPTDAFRPMYIFFNDAGALANVPGWASAEWSIQNFLAMADYDGDGWEDLAVSKWSNWESAVYRNDDGQILTAPIWTTGDTDSDKGVAWADVDGNGYPDLALGHDPTEIWSNDAGALSLGWTSGATYFGHSDIRFCDVDRDGDEDLAEIHFSDGKVHIYMNDGGLLESAPSWTYDSPTVGTAIAFGDINGDDWPDLVVGNSGEPCVKVFYADPATTVDGASPAPALSALAPAAPNPFNPSTTLRVRLDEAGPARLSILDGRGRAVRTLVDRPMDAGEHRVIWDGKDDGGRPAASGVYFARLVSPAAMDTEKLVLVR
ncbi:MAG: FG-GAP-like repeat-containing protein [Candidatus Eisenbacteria bacterium]